MTDPDCPAPDIHAALDGVQWLDAWWRWWRQQRRNHTQARFSLLTGAATGALPNVLARRYVPSRETIDAFNRVIQLDAPGVTCLQALFDIQRARTPADHAAALAAHQALQRRWEEEARRPVPPVYLEGWENVVLREAARRRPLPADAAVVEAGFRVPPPPNAVGAAIEWLCEAGLLVPAPEGGLVADRSAVESGGTVGGVRGTYRRALLEAAASLDGIPHEERELALLVFSLRREDLPAVRARIHAFLGEIRDLADATAEPDAVYQVAVQVVPTFALGARAQE